MNGRRRLLQRPLRWLLADPYRLGAAGLLLIGFLLRLYFLPLARFTGDEAFFFQEATRAAWGEWLPWIGPPVTGGPLRHPGGTFYLLMALPLTLSSSPLAAMGLVALLNTFAYGLLGAMARLVMGPRAALAFLLLLVTSPWSFFYSDRIWNSNLVLVLSALFLWALVHVATEPRSRRLFWLVFALGVFPQFHLSAPLLAFVGLVVLAVLRPRLHLRAGLAGAGAAALLYVPYLFQEIRGGFANSRLFLSGLGTDSEGPPEALRALVGFLTLPSAEMSYFAERGYWFRHDQLGYYTEGPGLAGMADFFGGGPAGWLLASLMLASLALAALAWPYLLGRTFARVRIGRREWNPLGLAFAAALVAAPGVFLLSGKPYYPHYVFSLYPLAFVPLLFLARRLLRSVRTGVPLALLLGAIAAGQVAMASVYYTRVDAVVGVESSQELVRAVYDSARDQTVHLSFDVERSRLSSGPLLQLARWSYQRPIRTDAASPRRYRIFSPARWAAFQALPAHRQRLDGRPVAEFRALSHAVIAWSDPASRP